MKSFMKTKAGVVLVGFSVLAVWMLLAAQPVQAQIAPSAPPGCPSSTIIRNIPEAATHTQIVDDSISALADTLVNDDDTGTPENERKRTLYFKLTVPALTAGELTVTAQTGDPRTVGRLCRGSSSLIVHPRTASDSTDDEPNFEAMMVPVTPGDYYVVVSGQNVDAAGVRQSTPAEGAVTVSVSFTGVRPTTPGTSAVGSLSSRGELDSYELTTSIVGLLTVKTTGNTDTKGMFTGTTGTADMAVEAEAGGSGGNFQIIAPVVAGAKTVSVQGQSPTTTGDYTLDVDFNVATSLTLATLGITYGNADDEPTEIKSGEADYFFFTVGDAERGFMTIQTVKHTSITTGAGTSTRGTLYGPKGLITMDDNSGAGGNFRLSAPVAAGNYIVKVEGQGAGPYTLEISTPADTASVAPGALHPAADADAVSVTPPGSTDQPHVGHYQIAVTTAGTLQVLTTGDVDTVGELYGPDGGLIATDENSGKDDNFKITQYVTMTGNYIVVVRAANRTTRGSYRLQTGFIEGVEVDQPTTPPDPTDPDPDPDPNPNPTGVLDEPPSGGIRSGIGIIRGWACQDAGEGIEIRIMNADGTRAATLIAPYGSARGDVDESVHCGRRERRDNSPVGFAAQFNYNTLAAGTYRVQAWVDGEQVGLNAGQTNTFTVVRISRDEFLQRATSGRIPVTDFPRQGTTTILEWDQPSQNFQIIDTE